MWWPKNTVVSYAIAKKCSIHSSKEYESHAPPTPTKYQREISSEFAREYYHSNRVQIMEHIALLCAEWPFHLVKMQKPGLIDISLTFRMPSYATNRALLTYNYYLVVVVALPTSNAPDKMQINGWAGPAHKSVLFEFTCIEPGLKKCLVQKSRKNWIVILGFREMQVKKKRQHHQNWWSTVFAHKCWQLHHVKAKDNLKNRCCWCRQQHVLLIQTKDQICVLTQIWNTCKSSTCLPLRRQHCQNFNFLQCTISC